MRTFPALALLGLAALTVAAAPLSAQTPATPATPATAAAPATPPAPPAKLDYDSLAFARQLTLWFFTSEVDSLWAHTTPDMQANMPGGKAAWSEMIGQFIERAGAESQLVEERWVKRNNRRQYWRIFRATDFADDAVMLRWVLLPGKMVGGLGMNPASQAPPVDPN